MPEFVRMPQIWQTLDFPSLLSFSASSPSTLRAMSACFQSSEHRFQIGLCQEIEAVNSFELIEVSVRDLVLGSKKRSRDDFISTAVSISHVSFCDVLGRSVPKIAEGGRRVYRHERPAIDLRRVMLGVNVFDDQAENEFTVRTDSHGIA